MCSAGVGRTGTFILIDRLLQHIQHENTIDIFGMILEMRGYRSNMIQTEVSMALLLWKGAWYDGALLQIWSSRDSSLGLETSRDPFLQVLVSVLVLEPSSFGLGLGLGTSESWSWSWNPRVSVSVLVLGLATMKTWFSSLMKRETVRLPPLLLWNGYLATVVC